MRIKINGEWMIGFSEVLLIIYLCVPISMLFLNSLTIKFLVVFAALLFILGLVMLKKWKYLLELLFLFSVTLLFWLVVWKRHYDSVAYIYYCFASLSFVFGAIILYKSEDSYLQHSLFVFLTVLYFITAITTIIGLSIYPYAAREMGRGSTYNASSDFDEYKAIYRQMNIAGWSQIYGILFAIPSMCMIWKKKKKNLFLLILLVLELSIIASQITFAILLSLGLIFFSFVSGVDNRKKIMMLFLILFIVILIYINLDNLLSWIIEISRGMGLEFIVGKFCDLRALLVDNQVVGDASVRGNLYKSSFDVFLSSPLVGAIFDNNVADNAIGRHSELLDLLGGIGLIGLIGILFSTIKYLKFLRKTKKSIRKDLRIIFIFFLILSFLNPVLSSPQIFVGAFLYAILSAKKCEYYEMKLLVT